MQPVNNSDINDLMADCEDAESFNYVFTALRGIQAGREYYSTMCPLRLIPKLFLFDEKEVPPKLRAQRSLNRSRIPAISRYIVEDPKNYVFSSITVSIDGRVSFRPFKDRGPASKTGYLVIPMSARFVINDGQHRRAAIEEALKALPELGSECISVVFFIDEGLKRSQQMFSDLNKHAIRPTMSLGILYNHRDPLARLCVELTDIVPVFRDRIELERTSISNRSVKLFTLSSLYQASRYLLGPSQKTPKLSQQDAELIVEYWSEVSENIVEWQQLLNKKITASELRKGYVHAHGISLLSLGVAGRDLVTQFPRNWKNKLNALSHIDWSRSNVVLWEGRAMNDGRIVASPRNIMQVANVIREALGLRLPKSKENLEHPLELTVKVGKR
jgi:DNA sulfur modification protein DndB